MNESKEITGIVGGVTEVSKAIVTSLTPQFLALIILNIGILGIVIWFISVATDQKLAIMNRVMDMCMQINPPPILKKE